MMAQTMHAQDTVVATPRAEPNTSAFSPHATQDVNQTHSSYKMKSTPQKRKKN